MTSGTQLTGEEQQPSAPTAPVATRRIAVFAGIALALGAALTAWLSTPHHDPQVGFLHSVNETIAAGRQARIVKLLVKPGQVVTPGTPLLSLQDASLEAARIQQQQTISSLEAELRQVQAKAAVEIADRKAKLEAELFETQLKLAGYEEKRFDQRLALLAAENRVMIAQAEERLSQVQIAFAAEGELPFEPLTVTPLKEPHKDAKPKRRDFLFELQERETTRNKLEASEAQVDLCEGRLKLLKLHLDGAAAQINEAFGVNVIQTRLASAQAALAKLDAEAPLLTIMSTRHGTVGTFLRTAGELIGPRETIVELFDADQPYVLADIPTNKLTQFPANSDVQLVFPGNERRQGTISQLPPQANILPARTEHAADRCGLLRIQILPKGQVWPQVPFGTYVEVSASCETQTRTLTSTERPFN